MLVIYLATLVTLVASDTLHFKPKSPADVLCPDKKGTCPDDSTCCLLTSGQYGCCPLKQATCCDDHIHCCPQGYTCNVGAGTCQAGNGESIPFLKKQPAKPVEAQVTCPGGQQSCPSGTTCCKLSTGGYGCCPYPEATCCSDGLHCCPEGYKCDLSTSTCSQGLSSFMWKELGQSKVKLESVKCPDGQSSCPDGSTCCQLLSGQYGCCPMVEAVCCSDHLHCCPKGTKCDVGQGRCQSSNGLSVPWFTKGPSNKIPETSEESSTPKLKDDIKCPDNISTCPEGTTCCKLLSGYYGCCNLPNAICCEDHLHCCASTQTCDTKTGTCKDGDKSVPWSTKVPANRAPEAPLKPEENKGAANVICPDKQGSCPSGSTCCKMVTGKYGCCPLDKATCCNDHIHCCPNGYTCDTTGGRCNPKSGYGESVVWSLKTVAEPMPEGIRCDGSYSCPDGTTCCKMGSSWGCCPMPQATCCHDGAHCCPHGFRCNPTSSACFRTPDIAAMKSVELQEAQNSVDNVPCPGGKASCPDGTTCCKLQTGEFGCCPFVKAVCCQDKLHCCPNGYTCDTAQGTCKQAEMSIPWAEKFAATKMPPTVEPVEEPVGAVVCPDKASQCPDGSTCCKLSTGSWGCCPLPEAVCCQDGQHCCPKGTKCNTAGGRCDSATNSLSISWDQLRRPSSLITKSKATVKCKDSTECPQGSTCCELASGKYGCCPLPDATCCADKVHCCPSGYTCDTAQGTCTKSGSSLEMSWWTHARTQSTVPWVEKVPAVTRDETLKNNAVMCPDHVHECPDGSTCCKLVSQEWGCCPLPNAVCCSDGQHCCPNGYKCDTSRGTCVSPSDIVTFLKVRP